MKACVFKAPGAPLEVVDVPDPKAGPGEVVVRVKNCGICGSDLHAAQWGVLPAGTIMGHEFSAVVDELGAGVSGLEPGESVMVVPMINCGNTTTAAPARRCYAPNRLGLDLRLPALTPRRSRRGLGTAEDAARVEPSRGRHGRAGGSRPARSASRQLQVGETCVVMGAGPIGLMTTMWARFAGARTSTTRSTSRSTR